MPKRNWTGVMFYLLVSAFDIRNDIQLIDSRFLGREFFVGISQWTNEAGARAVAAAFPEYPCTPIKVKPETLALTDLAQGFVQVSVLFWAPSSCTLPHFSRTKMPKVFTLLR
jgi:hypothetical protein